MLLETLNGKFNYSYFKVIYGENGECVIVGQYWKYPVGYYEGNTAYLICESKHDEKNIV